MSIRCEHEQTIRTKPERVFAAFDDLPLTAKWLPPCVSLTKVGEGPNAPGDKLHYVFKEGSRTSSMEGRIVDRVPGERLHCIYEDKMFAVSVDMRVSAAPEGAKCDHIIEITPKTLFGKLLSPLIRIGLKKQTRDAAANLKKLIEEEVA